MRKTAFVLLAMMAFVPSARVRADIVSNCDFSDQPGRQINACTALLQRKKLDVAIRAAAHINRGNAYAAAGKQRLAMTDYAAASKIEPDNHLPYYNRGNVYFDEKRYAEAIAQYSAAIERESNFAFSFCNRGVAYRKMGNVSKAIADFRAALSIDPAMSNARENLQLLEGSI